MHLSLTTPVHQGAASTTKRFKRDGFDWNRSLIWSCIWLKLLLISMKLVSLTKEVNSSWLHKTVPLPILKLSEGNPVKCSNKASVLYIHKGAFKGEPLLLNGHIMTCKKNSVPSVGEEEILILDMQGNRGRKLGQKRDPETRHHTNKMSIEIFLKWTLREHFSADLKHSQ